MKNKTLLRTILKSIIHKIEDFLSVFITHIKRPIYSNKVNITSDKLVNYPKCYIVIQGPIIIEKDFTLETIKIYKKLYPKTKIILSTWKDTDTKYLKKIQSALKIEKGNIYLILNKSPDYPGISNINLQTTSAYNGIKKAKELGAEYVVKTRTDQRMYGINNIEFLYNLIKCFPVKTGYKQKERIITMSLDTFKYRWYGASDMFNFGNIDDMLVYWGIELEDKEYFENRKKVNNDNKLTKFPICETKLVLNFLKKIGRKTKWTFEDSLQSYANHFCVVDQEDLDLYWYKYARLSEKKHFYSYEKISKKYELSFKEWINLYMGYENKDFKRDNKRINYLQKKIY